ncbi:Solute carrier family 22 member 3 [Eumeta japonica]|uniref:Solute carrier family 22 member 3 n=1 Tax=Eumeta variegata TaxID=151549 RepID=A0A4C1Z7L3_EUMVA|nr:Solute carrier family 22 member 3 [Eumeta japonica]
MPVYHSFVNFHHEPHGPDVFGRRRRRTSLTQFISQISSTTCRIPECESSGNATKWLQFALPEVKGSHSRCTRHPVIANRTDCAAHSFDNTMEERCTEFVYDDEDSIVREFDLGCQDWKRTLVGSVHNAGLFISLPLTGLISDRYGRKIALPLAAFMNGIFGIIRSFSVNYTMLLAFEFLEAAFGAGAYTTAFVLAMEIVGPKDRVFLNTLINAVYVFGLITLAGLAWALQNWRILLLTIYTPSLFVLSYLWILNESVRWLLSKGRNDEAANILNKAAAMNKVDLNDHVTSSMFELRSNTDKVEDSKDADGGGEGGQKSVEQFVRSGAPTAHNGNRIWSVTLRERSLGAETVRGLGVQTMQYAGAYHRDERKRGITGAARYTLRGTTHTHTRAKSDTPERSSKKHSTQ